MSYWNHEAASPLSFISLKYSSTYDVTTVNPPERMSSSVDDTYAAFISSRRAQVTYIT
jgi:hypothetical protein